MNAPLPRHLSPSDGRSVVAQEIAVGTRPLARARRGGKRRRRGRRDSDRVVHNHSTERWMVSYADFVTLLFAFFVVMYAVSSVNEGRYRVLSGALSTAFSPSDGDSNGGGPAPKPDGRPVAHEAPGKGIVAIAATVPDAAPAASAPAPPAPATPPMDPADQAEVRRTAERVQHMTQLATRVDERLQSLVRDGQVTVTRGARGIAIEINAAVLFDPAKADLKPASFDALRSLSSVLSGFVEPLQIEGHSDDVPIATREFKSNWELSAARAASVGRFLIDQGVAPSRIGIAGYAEFRPLTGNTSADTRARNRRVTLLVLSADDARPKDGPSSGPGSAPAEVQDPTVASETR